MEKLIITACICGAEVTKEQNPNVPYTVEEIVREAKSAYDAGAAIIHLHVREDDGTPTQSADRFKECIDAIRKELPDVIIQPSTGGAVGMSNEERLAPIDLDPEMATLDCGTCNFGGDEIFVNTENMIVDFAKKMNEHNVKPEIEVFDKGMVDMAIRLHKKGFIKAPMHFDFVMGVNGGISGTPRDLLTMAILMGGHARVGFEDNIYLSKGVMAKSNGELVEKVVRLAKELGREIATPDEARKILGLK